MSDSRSDQDIRLAAVYSQDTSAMFSFEHLNLKPCRHEAIRAASLSGMRRLILIGAFLVLFQGSSARAQHCGRVGYLPEWNQSQMAWDDAVVALDQADGWRMKGRACDGPMCQSRTPQPLSPHVAGVGATAPMPWRCTAFGICPIQDKLAGHLTDLAFVSPSDPCLDQLFKPPRSV